jgi:cell division protein FtsQ
MTLRPGRTRAAAPGAADPRAASPGAAAPGAAAAPGPPDSGAADAAAADPEAGVPIPAGAGAEGAARAGGRRRRDPWRTAFFGVLVLAILAGAAWALLGSSLLVVRHERVAGNHDLSPAAVLAAAGVRHGTPMASVDTGAAARRVEQITQVLSATVARSWPDTLVITVVLRTPALAVASSGQFALIDGSGVTVRVSPRRPAGMPLLTHPPAQLRGSGGVRAAVTILGRLPRHLRRLIESVSAPSADTVTFTLRGGITVVWGAAGHDAAKAAELAVLMRTRARYYDVSDPMTAVTQG